MVCLFAERRLSGRLLYTHEMSQVASEHRPAGVTRARTDDGLPNPKYVDVLDEDKAIAGQRFVCLSFISPEKVLKDKNLFYFQNYLREWELNKGLEKYTQFTAFLAHKYGISLDDLTQDLKGFCEEERENLFTTTLPDEFKTYMDANEDKLEKEFSEQNQFRTTVRGVKVRGCYPTQQEAELRCKMLREVDPNHDVFVGPVGMWMPWHPDAYKTGRVEYVEEELNQLMHEKKKNEAQAKAEFDKRVRETKEKAMEDNQRKAKESGNVLTQTINEGGELVSVKDMNTTETGLGEKEVVATADIRRELFEGDNVVIDHKSSDHGVSRLINAPDSIREAAAAAAGAASPDHEQSGGEEESKGEPEEGSKVKNE